VTHFSHVFVWEDEKQKTEMEDKGGAARTAGVAGGTAVSSTPPDDLEMQEGQDDKAVAGSGTHLAGVVGKSRTKVTHSNYNTQLQYTHKSYTPPKPPIWSCTTSGNTNPRKFRQTWGHRSLAIGRSCLVYVVLSTMMSLQIRSVIQDFETKWGSTAAVSAQARGNHAGTHRRGSCALLLFRVWSTCLM